MPVLYRGECRRSLTSIKSEQGTMVITEKALFWWKSHRTKTVWSGKKEEDPPTGFDGFRGSDCLLPGNLSAWGAASPFIPAGRNAAALSQ